MTHRAPTLLAALIAVATTGGRAIGDPVTAADVATSPKPGDESGRIDTVDGGDSTARKVGRVALFLPKLAFDVVFAPVRGGLWLFERYQLDARFKQIFFNDAYTIGLYPTVSYESGFGVSVGARFVHRDLFGAREHFSLLGGFGGQFREVARATLRSGNRFGDRLQLELVGEYERRPQDGFYGIGNGDRLGVPPMLVDPLTDTTAVETRYRQRLMRTAAIADVRPLDAFHVIASGALADHTYGPGEAGTPIDMVYDPRGLVGWDGTRQLYGELELRWDGRHAEDLWEPRPVISAGSLASVFGGRAHRLDAGGVDYWRYGLDLQQFIRLGVGPRVLIARLHGEGVTGARDQVPFADLPQLGGSSVLRGYGLDRFRDRVAAVGTLEYRWDLSRQLDAGVFTDVGRVYPSLRDLSVDHLRLGYGVALEMHSDRGFLFEGSVASSIDGGLFFNLSLSPVFDLDPRVRRR